MKVSHFNGLTLAPSMSHRTAGAREGSAARGVLCGSKKSPYHADNTETLILRGFLLSPTLRSAHALACARLEGGGGPARGLMLRDASQRLRRDAPQHEDYRDLCLHCTWR